MERVFCMRSIMISIFCIICAFILGFIINNCKDRYKLYLHPTYRADQYLLDSKTGNVWHLVQDSNENLIWELMPKYVPDIEDNKTENQEINKK